ncbi:MAG: restriction endonuclease [Desulfomonile tiedjei]|nr:restriction endonuclease [Desulfomonile tiedjei]
MAGQRFAQYIVPLVNALKELGNSGTPTEVRDTVAKNLALSDRQLDEQLKSGSSRFVNDVHWARFYLVKSGYLDSSERGVWRLTEKGLREKFTDKLAQEIAKKVRFDDRLKSQTNNKEIPEDQIAPSDLGGLLTGEYRADLLELMRQMPPDAFERLCQRFLREAGFQQVEVTGRSGDGGIDGKGLLQVNPLMNIQVLFQCKRYKGAVGSSEIRNFRGAMTGRTDKGIFITTGSFTADARREALRDGAPPIELVDADKLVSMFEMLELGLKPRRVLDIDHEFWNEFF